jgi:hypothetical protein
MNSLTHTPAALPLGKSLWYTLKGRMGRPQIKHFGKQKNLFALPSIKPWIILPTASKLFQD